MMDSTFVTSDSGTTTIPDAIVVSASLARYLLSRISSPEELDPSLREEYMALQQKLSDLDKFTANLPLKPPLSLVEAPSTAKSLQLRQDAITSKSSSPIVPHTLAPRSTPLLASTVTPAPHSRHLQVNPIRVEEEGHRGAEPQASERSSTSQADRRTYRCMSKLMTACSLLSVDDKWASDLFCHFLNARQISENAPFENSLLELAKTCERNPESEIVQLVGGMLSDIQLKAKADSIRISENLPDNISVYRQHLESHHRQGTLKLSEQCFNHSCRHGALFGALAKAGTPYFLFIIAAAQCKTLVSKEICRAEIENTCRCILRPSPKDRLGQLVISTLIPIISRFRERYSFEVNTMFSEVFLLSLGLEKAVNSAILSETDAFFDKLRPNDPKIERDLQAWQSCISSSAPELAASPDEAEVAQILAGGRKKRKADAKDDCVPVRRQRLMDDHRS